MDKTTILVCCHKPDDNIRTGYPYFPIQGGKAIHPEIDLGFPGDDTGDNVSERNQGWCEASAMYWAWKNLPRAKYFGMSHYRRYVDIDVSDEKIDEEMGDYDMIVTKKSAHPVNNSKTLQYFTCRENFWIFADTFLEMHPEYGNEFIDYFFNQNWFYPCNVFVCKWEVFEDYCEFMMPVLLEVDRRMIPGVYTRQVRAMSYIAELMLSFFVHCKKIKVREANMKTCYEEPDWAGKRYFRSTLERKAYFTAERWLGKLFFRLSQAVGKTHIIADPDVILWLEKDGIKLNVLSKPFYYDHSRDTK